MTTGDRIGVARAAPVGYIIGERRENESDTLLPTLRVSLLDCSLVFWTLPKVRCFHSPQKVVTMRHPFQVGDLVRSTMNPSNLALVTETHKIETGYYVDVTWFRSGKEVTFYSIKRFTLVSRAEG